MRKLVIAISVMAIVILGFCGCGKNNSEGNMDIQLHNIDEYRNDSVDDIEINNISIELDKWDEDEVYVNLLINITNKFDFDCSTVGVLLKLIDENNNVIEKTNATINNIASGKSGNATVTLADYADFEKTKTIEIYYYGASTQKDKKIVEVEGGFSEKQLFDINDISVKEQQNATENKVTPEKCEDTKLQGLTSYDLVASCREKVGWFLSFFYKKILLIANYKEVQKVNKKVRDV